MTMDHIRITACPGSMQRGVMDTVMQCYVHMTPKYAEFPLVDAFGYLLLANERQCSSL